MRTERLNTGKPQDLNPSCQLPLLCSSNSKDAVAFFWRFSLLFNPFSNLGNEPFHLISDSLNPESPSVAVLDKGQQLTVLGPLKALGRRGPLSLLLKRRKGDKKGTGQMERGSPHGVLVRL